MARLVAVLLLAHFTTFGQRDTLSLNDGYSYKVAIDTNAIDRNIARQRLIKSFPLFVAKKEIKNNRIAGKPYDLYKVVDFDSANGTVWLWSIYSDEGVTVDKESLDYFFWTQKEELVLRKKWGADWYIMRSGYLYIGWSKEKCKMAWGEPEKINKTITRSHVDEQWVYGSSYLYFTDGKLTTIQN